MGTAAQEGVPRPADRPEPGLADRLSLSSKPPPAGSGGSAR
jgi:hypothetical protein